MTVHILSAIFGGFDKPNPPMKQSIDCTWTMVTNDPSFRAPGWNVVLADIDRPSPRLSAKRPKLYPWHYTPGDGPWIWIDGAFGVTSPTFAEEAVVATTGPLGQWRHPRRDCVYEEAAVCIERSQCPADKALEQVADYRRRGHPEHGGLWATGLIVYREPLLDLADRWWSELERHTHRDQISQAVVLRELGLRPVDLPGGLHDSPWLAWHHHEGVKR